MPVPIPSEACVRAESGRVKSASAGRKKTGPNFMGPVRYSGTDDLSYGRRPCPALSGRCDGDAGVAGVAGVAGLAGVAGPPSGFGTAGVARVARVAGVAGVTGRLSNPTASPRTCVARRAIFAATFALATSDACSLGAATLGVWAASSAGRASAGTNANSRFNMLPPWHTYVSQSELGTRQLSGHGAERTQGSTGPDEARRCVPELRKHVADDALRQIRIHQDAVRLRVQRAAMTALQLDHCGRVMLHPSLDPYTNRHEGGDRGSRL